MGARHAPRGTIIKTWKLERNSIYSDLRLSHNFYGRFYDDLGSIVINKRRVQMICNAFDNEGPDKLIKLTMDYPENSEEFSPLLNVEVKIERDVIISTRLFRKPQKNYSHSMPTHTIKQALKNTLLLTCTRRQKLSRQTLKISNIL